MKATTYRNNHSTVRSRIPYPNAATLEERLHKILETLISAVIGAGIGACVLLLAAIL